MLNDLVLIARRICGLVGKALFLIWRHPKMMLPLLTIWTFIVVAALSTKRIYDADPSWLVDHILLFGFLYYLGYSIVIVYSTGFLLELLQQLESGQKLSVRRAAAEFFQHNLLQLFPIAVLWCLLLFVLFFVELILRVLLSGKDGKPTMASRAVQEGFALARKGIRMSVFLMLPAVAWENRSAFDAFYRAFDLNGDELAEFLKQFMNTILLTVVIWTPLCVLTLFTGKLEWESPPIAWLAVSSYTAAGFALIVTIEQIICAEFFLLVRARENAYMSAASKNEPTPDWDDIPKPSLFDNNPQFDEMVRRRRLPLRELGPPL